MRKDHRINVTYLAGQLGLGGAEQQLYYLLSRLDRTRFSPAVINLAPDQPQAWVTPIVALDVAVYSVPRSVHRFKRLIQIRSFVRECGTQIVHSWVFHTNIYAAFSNSGKLFPIRIGSIRTNPDRLARQRLLYWIGQKGLDMLVTNSNVAQCHLSMHGKRVVRYIPNGVPIPQSMNRDQIAKLKIKLGFLPTARLIGCIGRLDRNKNQAMLIRAFSALSARWPNTFLVFIGAGEQRAELLSLADLLGISDYVYFLGEVPHASHFLPAFELICLTSYYEGMPNVIMEASAAGLPVVATNTGGALEIIDHEKTGFLIKPDDDITLINCLEELLSSPAKATAFGSAGLTKMATEFSVDAMAGKMMEMYEDLLRAKCAF